MYSFLTTASGTNRRVYEKLVEPAVSFIDFAKQQDVYQSLDDHVTYSDNLLLLE